MKVEEILNECRDLVEQVCTKFNYDNQDKEGNQSLKTVLLKAIPAMLESSNQEDRKLFYQMLSHTEIVITENLTQESYDEMLEQYIGKNLNQHIIEENIDLGEYGKNFGVGAYVSEPILDENMNLQGKKSFIYIQKLTGKSKELFGTDINVEHLIHELGHAWHAEKEQFIMQDDGTLKERIGTSEFTYSFSKTADNKFIKKCTNISGLMLEESMNTVAQEDATANYLGISLKELREEYKSTLIPSNYQGYMGTCVRYMLEEMGKDDFEHYRLYGVEESKNKINKLMEKTEFWKNRETDILQSSDSPRSYGKKREILDRIDKPHVQEFFQEYESVYFPDISKMTPIEKIENVLEQAYDMNTIRFSMGLNNYKDFVTILASESYSLINQTIEIKQTIETEKTKTITPSSAVKNALKQGTSTYQVSKAASIEISEQNNIHIKEGVTKDD